MFKEGEKIVIVLWIIGILCILYFVLYAAFTGLTNVFTYFWLFAGGLSILRAVLPGILQKHNITIPKGIKWSGGIAAVVCTIAIIVAEGFIISYGISKPDEGAGYVIVLGAQVRGNTPSYNLVQRLDAAYDYLQENPETIAILSGGKGDGEDISEAQAMAEYLEEKGLSKERMILESESVNTYENIKYSKQLMKSQDMSVIIVTNDFHVFRGVRIAEKQGLENVQGLGSSTHWYTVPNLYLREAFAVIKYFVCGQI